MEQLFIFKVPVFVCLIHHRSLLPFRGLLLAIKHVIHRSVKLDQNTGGLVLGGNEEQNAMDKFNGRKFNQQIEATIVGPD